MSSSENVTNSKSKASVTHPSNPRSFTAEYVIRGHSCSPMFNKCSSLYSADSPGKREWNLAANTGWKAYFCFSGNQSWISESTLRRWSCICDQLHPPATTAGAGIRKKSGTKEPTTPVKQKGLW